MKVSYNRPPLHPANVERIQTALNIGMSALRSPVRAGWLTVRDDIGLYDDNSLPQKEFYERMERIGEVITKIENRGVGKSILMKLTEEISRRARTNPEPFFISIARIKSSTEKNALNKAIAEWADGDSIAAHIGYQNDYFCTEDQGHNAGISIFDNNNRAWLKENFNVKFLTAAELAELLN